MTSNSLNIVICDLRLKLRSIVFRRQRRINNFLFFMSWKYLRIIDRPRFADVCILFFCYGLASRDRQFRYLYLGTRSLVMLMQIKIILFKAYCSIKLDGIRTTIHFYQLFYRVGAMIVRETSKILTISLLLTLSILCSAQRGKRLR